MAAKDKKDENDADEAQRAKPERKASPIVLIIVGAVALFVAVLGAQVAAPILTEKLAHAPKADGEATGDEEQQLAEAAPADAGSDQPTAPLEPAIYTPLDPPFVVSFNAGGGESRFVQLSLQAMARKEKTIDAIKQHAPAIRNAFLLLINGYTIEELSTVEGKEKLRAALLKSANEILEKNTGSGDIEELYFTSLVIQ
jgi:flagellar FliL protein